MPTESNIVQEFAEGPTPDTVDAFGKVAEGPLIKYNPGGFAQFRAETTGLPPARAQFGDQEFWGQLVTPTTTKLDTVPTGPKDPIDPDGTGGLSNDQIDAIVKESDDANKELEDWYRRSSSDDLVDFDKYRLDIPDPKINWDTSDIGYTGYDYRKDPDFLEGDLISADRNFEPIQIPLGPGGGGPIGLAPRTPQPKQDRPRISITPKGIPKPEKDLPPVKGTSKNTTGIFKPTLGDKAAQTLQDIFSATEKPARILFGKTRYDAEGPLRKDERQTFDTLKKFKDWSDGLTEEQFKLWETKGIPSETTGRAPVGPKYGKMLADFGRILKNEENIRTQEYGDLQLLAALNTAALISQYGAIGGAIPVLVTASDDIMSGMNNMFAKSPELAGNPIQDFVHGTTWVLGKTLQKTYNNTIGQVLPKIKDTRIKDKLGNIDEFMKAPRRPNMGTKTVISMPDPDGTIRTDRNISKGIPEAERQQVTAQTTSTVTDPATATTRPISVRNIGRGVPTGATTRPTGDTPVSQTTSTRPKVETREALTANITDKDKQKIDDGTTVTEQEPTGIKIENIDDAELDNTKDGQDKDIETAELDLRYRQPVETKIVDPIVVSPKGKEKKDEIKTEKNPKLKTSKTEPELVDAKSIKIKEGDKKPDPKIKGLKIEKAGDVVSKEDKKDVKEADLNLEYKKLDESELDKIKSNIEKEQKQREEQKREEERKQQEGKKSKDKPKFTIDVEEVEPTTDPPVTELPFMPEIVDTEVDEDAKLDDPPEEQPDDDLEYTPETGVEAPDGLYYSTYYNVPVDADGNPFGTSGWNESRYKGKTLPVLNMAFGLDPNNPEIGGKVGEKPSGEEMDWNSRMQDFRDKNALGENVGSRTDYEVDFGNVDPTIGGGGSVKINMEENPYGLNNPDFPGQGYNEDPNTYQRIADSQTGVRWDASINDFVPWNPDLPESNNPDNPQYWGPERDIPQGGGEATGGEEQDEPISNWPSQANLPDVRQDSKPVYGPDGMFMGFESVNLYLEHESYRDNTTPSGWGYRYRYVDPSSFDFVPWEYWSPSP